MILLVVDVQVGLDDACYGLRNNPECEKNIASLLSVWRGAGLPLFYTRHVSNRSGSPLAADDPRCRVKEEIAPRDTEQVFTKQTNSVFKRDDFMDALIESRSRELVMVGLTTDICITACARDALDLSYDVIVVGDACATFNRGLAGRSEYPAETIHNVALASLAVSGAKIRTTSEVIARLDH